MKGVGSQKAPNFRVAIKRDQEILRSIPEDQTTRRAELQQAIDMRIDDLISAITTARSLREEATAYKGNWRYVVLSVCVALFTVIWWDVPHTRTNWPLTFIVLILVALVTAGAVTGADGGVACPTVPRRGPTGTFRISLSAGAVHLLPFHSPPLETQQTA